MESEKKYTDCFKWQRNDAWYDYDNEKREFFLTDKAPAEARHSFERWQAITGKEEIRRRLELDWRENNEWYYFDEEHERYVLTDKAPEMARKSFELWEKINGVD